MNVLPIPNKIDWSAPLRQASTRVEVDDLKELFVSSYDLKDPDSNAPRKHCYQRNPNQKRFPKIGRYYAAGKDAAGKDHDSEHKAHIPPLLISIRAQGDAEIMEFVKMFEKKDYMEIKERWNKAIMSVVDGQHRKGGLEWARKNIEDFDAIVPLELFFNLTISQEAQLFNTVNAEQKRLPKALIEVSKGDIIEVGEKTHHQQIREIAFGLIRDKDSVWFDSVNMTGARNSNYAVTYEGLRRSMSNMFTSEVMERIVLLDLNPLEDFAKPYWEIISKLSPKAWNGATRSVEDEDTGEITEVPIKYRLKELVGVASLARLGRDIITSALEAQQDYSVPALKAMKKKMTPLGEIDWEKSEDNPWMASQAGFAGQKQLYTDLYKLVYSDIRPDD